METQNAPAATVATIHPFQAAGLGLAPFRYIGQVHQDIAYGQAVVNSTEFRAGGPMVTTQPGGTCAYCGHYILHMFNVKSVDGRTFHVGSDCIAKVGGPELARKVAKVVSANRKTRAAASADEKIAAARVTLARAGVRAKLAAEKHPASSGGQSMLSYVEWLLANAGTSGKLRAAAIVSEAAGVVSE